MQLSLFEKRSIIGMLLAIGLFAASIYQIGKRNLWFEHKSSFRTKVSDADGLRVGGYVTVSGLRVGDISSLEVDDDNQISVTLSIKDSIAKRITKGTYVEISRAFVIGEKRIEIIPGPVNEAPLLLGSLLPSKTQTDLAEFVSGRKLSDLITNVESLIAGLTTLNQEVQTIFGKYHNGSFDKAISLVEPSLENFLKLSDDLIVISREMKKHPRGIPDFVANGNTFMRSMHDDLFKEPRMRTLVENLNASVLPFAKKQELVANLLSSLDDLAGQLKQNPEYANKILDAVGELSLTLKALQKTWMLESKTKEVKEEQNQLNKSKP